MAGDFENITLDSEWKEVLDKISINFGKVDDLKDILFLIGVQELGQGYRKFTKNEKLDVMHIALCKLLSYYGYYVIEGRDQDGWPHWKLVEKIPSMSEKENELLLKKAVITYFEKE